MGIEMISSLDISETCERRILVTGGAGFIGSHLILRFLEKYPKYYIVNLDCLDYCSCHDNITEGLKKRKMNGSYTMNVTSYSKNYKFVKGSILSSDLVNYILLTEKIDTIFHFAAQSHVDNSFGNSLAFSKHNIVGTHVLLEAAKNNRIESFIYVSTDEVYGEGKEGSPAMDESHVLEPTNPYAATKAAAEFLVKAYYRSFNLPVIITRSNNIYGPHQYPEKLIPKLINQLMRNRKMTLHGDGKNKRNYLYIEDAVNAFDLIFHKGIKGEVYNIGGTNELSNVKVAEDILHIMFPQIKIKEQCIFVHDRAFNDQRYCIKSDKLNDLGWRENYTWKDGLAETVKWYLENPNRYQDIEYSLDAHPKLIIKNEGIFIKRVASVQT